MMDSGISRDAAIPETENYVCYPALLGLLRGDLSRHDLFVVTIESLEFLHVLHSCYFSSSLLTFLAFPHMPPTVNEALAAILLLHYIFFH